MSDLQRIALQVTSTEDSDVHELEQVTGERRTELLDLEVEAVDPPAEHDLPPPAKGLGTPVGALVARFATVESVEAIVAAVRGWTARTNYVVEVSLESDVLKVNDVTSAQQDKIIEARLARHTAST